MSLGSILALSSHPRLGLQIGLFPSGFPTKILYAFRISPMHATGPINFIILGLITLIKIGEAYKL